MAKKNSQATTKPATVTEPVATQEETVTAEANVATEPAAEPEVQPVPAPEPTPVPVIKEEATSDTVIGRALRTYAESMAPNKPTDARTGAKHQKAFRAAIINAVTDADETKAVANIKEILNFIHNDKTGVFSIRSLFRFYDVTPWNSKEDRREIESLLALFENTADPSTRGNEIKKLDWSGMGRFMSPTRSETIMRRLRIAYNVG
jgi:hypothetical protein